MYFFFIYFNFRVKVNVYSVFKNINWWKWLIWKSKINMFLENFKLLPVFTCFCKPRNTHLNNFPVPTNNFPGKNNVYILIKYLSFWESYTHYKSHAMFCTILFCLHSFPNTQSSNLFLAHFWCNLTFSYWKWSKRNILDNRKLNLTI